MQQAIEYEIITIGILPYLTLLCMSSCPPYLALPYACLSAISYVPRRRCKPVPDAEKVGTLCLQKKNSGTRILQQLSAGSE
jgi:hypothetical protein